MQVHEPNADLGKITGDNNWFSQGPSAPLELKILAVLRILGRGYCFDGGEELCFIRAQILRIVFNKFCDLLLKGIYVACDGGYPPWPCL